jgi:hypothetical protein
MRYKGKSSKVVLSEKLDSGLKVFGSGAGLIFGLRSARWLVLGSTGNSLRYSAFENRG